MADILLNVAHIRRRSRVNGPGVRSVVWVQGCTICCPGCFNPDTHPHKPVKLLDPRQLAEELLAIPDTEGITLSGGEPFEQAEACAILTETIRKAGPSVMVFTGCPYEHLQESEDPSVQRFLASIDLLVAGPYVERLKIDVDRWRASSNQQILALTDRYADLVKSGLSEEAVVEVSADGGVLSFTGFPDRKDLRWLRELSGGQDGPAAKNPEP